MTQERVQAALYIPSLYSYDYLRVSMAVFAMTYVLCGV